MNHPKFSSSPRYSTILPTVMVASTQKSPSPGHLIPCEKKIVGVVF